MKFRFNREIEITMGGIIQFAGYVLMAIYFALKLAAGQEAIKEQVGNMQNSIDKLTDRLDRHVDKGK